MHALQDVATVDVESHAMCPEAEVPLDQSPPQQLLQQLPESVQEIARLHSLDSINALMWPASRRVSSAGSRSTQSSGHLHLYVDHASDHLHLYVGQPQLQQTLPPQPMTFPRLRSTASINALVWPASRAASSRSGGSHAEAAENLEEGAGPDSVRSEEAATAVAVLKSLPSATSIDALLWPGDAPIEQPPAAHAMPAEAAAGNSQSNAFGTLPFRLTAVGTAEVPARSSATFRAQKQQSLLDRAAAKRALAALLAAAKASQIRGWSPRQRASSPALSEHAEPAAPAALAKEGPFLPSLEDIEALVPFEETR